MKKAVPKWQLVAGLLFLFWLGDWMATTYLITPGALADKLKECINLGVFLMKPYRISFQPVSLLSGVFAASCGELAYYSYYLTRQKRMPNIEYGSARWGTPEDIKPIQGNPENNIPLSQTESMTMEPWVPGYSLNKNILIFGGSGSQKTRSEVLPGIMQMNGNYIVTDPKGEILYSTGKMLSDNGYKIKVFNLKDFSKSDHYNLFHYLHDETDVVKVAKNLVTNLKEHPEQQSSADPIWEEGMIALIEALICFVRFELQPEQRNMNTVMDLTRMLEVQENNPHFESKLDVLFDNLERDKPGTFAYKQYAIYKQAAGKTAKSFNVSLGMRLSAFNIPAVANLVMNDTLELEDFGTDQKIALFIIISDTDASFNFLAAILYQQLFDMLVRIADEKPGGRLPRHCRFLLDEFANIGQIPSFKILISTIRSRNISATIIYQSLSQLKSQYKDDWGTIMDNCSTMVFLGGTNNMDNLEYLSKMLGKATIEAMNTSENRGGQGSFTKSWQGLGRELMTPDELRRDDSSMCIVLITGLPAFHSKKYDLTKHRNYHLLAQADEANGFSFEMRNKVVAEQFLQKVKTVTTVEPTEE